MRQPTDSDAMSQLLGFFKMSFYLFSVYSVLVMTILMPVNWLVRLVRYWHLRNR